MFNFCLGGIRKMSYKKLTSSLLTTGLVALGAVIGLVIALFLTNFLKYDRYVKKDFIDRDAYQAIFLTNDQIYFGRLKNISSDYLILKDVYYVKVGESGSGQIVKLGASEPHGPKDEMVINQDQVIFWENLRPDSSVVKVIQSTKN